MLKSILMKRICTLLTAVACMLLIFSCKKDKTAPAVITPTMYIPTCDVAYMANIMQTTTDGANLGSPISNVWGIFIITRLENGMADTTDSSYYHYDGWQEVFFCGTDGTGFIGAKAVALNNSNISQTGNIYFGDSKWHTNSLNHWEVSGDSNIPPVSANMMDSYPDFSGSIPDTIFLNRGLTYTFNPSSIKDADSAFFLIHSNGHVVKSNTVSVNTGNVKPILLSQAQLTNMRNEYFSIDNRIFRGGVLDMVLFKDTLETFGNKQFAFVSQRQILRKVFFK